MRCKFICTNYTTIQNAHFICDVGFVVSIEEPVGTNLPENVVLADIPFRVISLYFPFEVFPLKDGGDDVIGRFYFSFLTLPECKVLKLNKTVNGFSWLNTDVTWVGVIWKITYDADIWLSKGGKSDG